MIVTFPLLMDATINSSVVPGVCKNLERYCLIHKLDTILKWGGLPSDSRIVQWGIAAAQAAGSVLLASETKKGNVLREDDIHIHNTGNEKVNVITGDKEEKKPHEPDRAVDVRGVDVKSTLSIEPTWVTIQSKKGSAVIGVKVIPYPIPAEPFVEQLISDHSLKFFDRLVARYERTLTRQFYNMMRRLPIFHLNLDLKKDPLKDIIYARSKYGWNVFCMLNLASIENDEIFKEQGGVSRLFKLGWQAVIVADDVTQRLVFCLKEDGGLCSIVHYPFLYSALGRDQADAYGKLSDLQKSTSPFFTHKVRLASFFGESIAYRKLKRFAGLGFPCIDCEDK